MSGRKFPTGLPLVDVLRSSMLQRVPRGQTSGGCTSLPYEAAELIHDLYDALEALTKAVNTNELAAAMACHEIVTFANVEDALKLAIPALAKARGEAVSNG